MLIVPHRSLLNDGTLNGEEAILRYRQGTERFLTDHYKLYDHEDLKNLNKRAGQRMLASEFIRLVTSLNPRIFVEQQINFPDQWGFYTEVSGRKVYLSAFSKGWVSEFSAVLVDHQDLPVEEIRGWRTCLVRLLSWGALNWSQVVNTFGNSEGLNSARWLKATADFRAEACCRKVHRNLFNKMTTSAF